MLPPRLCCRRAPLMCQHLVAMPCMHLLFVCISTCHVVLRMRGPGPPGGGGRGKACRMSHFLATRSSHIAQQQ
jgi:hypothetical protein